LNETVGDVTQGVNEDGKKQYPGAAKSVAQHAPEDAAQHESEHLYVDDE
jgi:hypothetical protein